MNSADAPSLFVWHTGKRTLIFTAAVALFGWVTAACQETPPTSSPDADPWPTRVLVTNDNGIDDTGLVELARALARDGIEVTVVAAQQDRSGASNYMSATRVAEYRVERRDLGPGIEAYALDGQPADCVVFGLSGPMRDNLPDLVVSGINGGPNLADDWFGSGTIGAARTAAYFGVPAIAVSGVEDDDPELVAAATAWVAQLVRSEIVRGLRAPEYLTVSLPLATGREVRGVRLAERARGLMEGRSERSQPSENSEVASEDGAEAEIWTLEFRVDPSRAGPDSDVAIVSEGYIAIVPMRADESDGALMDRLASQAALLPAWPGLSGPEGESALSEASDQACDRTLGIEIDDAEDESGREWGVVVEVVVSGSRAEGLDLRPGDVMTVFNGVELVGEGSLDPDDQFARFYSGLACGDAVELELVREGATLDLSFVVGG